MFKRVLLVCAFLVTFVAAGAVITEKAAAHGGRCGYRTAYYGVYPSYYDYGYAPRVVYYPNVYSAYYGGFYAPVPRHHHRHNGVSISFGF